MAPPVHIKPFVCWSSYFVLFFDLDCCLASEYTVYQGCFELCWLLDYVLDICLPALKNKLLYLYINFTKLAVMKQPPNFKTQLQSILIPHSLLLRA